MKSQEGKIKREYDKPRIRIIELAAEEVLAPGCKMEATGVAPLAIPCWINNCVQVGS